MRRADPVGHLAWPIVVLAIGIAFRHKFIGVLGALTERTSDPHTKVSLTKMGLHLDAKKLGSLQAPASNGQ